MVALIQRVDEAQVYIEAKLHDYMGKACSFLGIACGDAMADADYLLDKVLHLRIFEDDDGKMNLSLLDIAGELLVVSQFTLTADCRKGRRPSFSGAASPDQAKPLYDYFIDRAKQRLGRIACGEFQAMMKIRLINDGPVTLSVTSRDKEVFKLR